MCREKRKGEEKKTQRKVKKKTAQTDIDAFLKNQGYRSLGTLHVQRSGLRYHIKMLTWKVKRTVSLKCCGI